MHFTKEQQLVLDHITKLRETKQDEVLLINAVAGAGKTFLLTQIAEQNTHSSAIYLAYNKSVAVEAAQKFPKSVSCSTIHALAYRAVVKQLGFKVGSFSYKDINASISYDHKLWIVECIKEFCLSRYTNFDEFSKELDYPTHVISLCKAYLEKMYKGEIECSHDFYLKVFHMGLVSEDIRYPKQDFLFIDESGDVTEVALEIFKLLPSQIKIAVGDNCQNIYAFNYTINAFEIMKDSARFFNLTESFRVDKKIAKRIETFCTTYINEDMVFVGTEIEDRSIVTRAFLTRTNAGLISTLLELRDQGMDFNLVRRPVEIFKVPLMLCFLKYQGTITDPSYRHLQVCVDDWYETPDLQQNHRSPLSYITSLYEFDTALVGAARLLINKGKQAILDIYDYAKSCENKKSNLWVATAHSVKGLEYDEVIIVDDLNSAVATAIADPTISEADRMQDFNLYYVACSRAKKSLLNAKALK